MTQKSLLLFPTLIVFGIYKVAILLFRFPIKPYCSNLPFIIADCSIHLHSCKCIKPDESRNQEPNSIHEPTEQIFIKAGPLLKTYGIFSSSAQ